MISASFSPSGLLACLVLLATAHGAASSTSKGNKPSAAIDETAEMLCNVLVQASKELIHDGSVKVNLLKDYLRQDCSKLPKTLNLLQKVSCSRLVAFHKQHTRCSFISVPSRCRYLRHGYRRTSSDGHGRTTIDCPSDRSSFDRFFLLGSGQDLPIDSGTRKAKFDSSTTEIVEHHTESNLRPL